MKLSVLAVTMIFLFCGCVRQESTSRIAEVPERECVQRTDRLSSEEGASENDAIFPEVPPPAIDPVLDGRWSAFNPFGETWIEFTHSNGCF